MGFKPASPVTDDLWPLPVALRHGQRELTLFDCWSHQRPALREPRPDAMFGRESRSGGAVTTMIYAVGIGAGKAQHPAVQTLDVYETDSWLPLFLIPCTTTPRLKAR